MVEWRIVRVAPFRKTARWICGAVLQEAEGGRRRVKLFKGYIKDSGKYSVVYKGREVRFSMIQRFNIPSRRYWESLKKWVDNLFETEGASLDAWLGDVQKAPS